MGTQPDPMLQERNDPKYIDLINKIAEKTRAKKIRWKRTETGVSATVSDKMELGFVRSPWVGLGGRSLYRLWWALFKVRDENGNEILRVDNVSPLEPGEPEAAEQKQLRDAVETLYAAIEQSGRAEVEKAIELIDKI